jgi:hypothetical protein
MKCELCGMWKEAVLVCFKTLFQTSGVTEKCHGKLNRNNRKLCWEYNLGASECEAGF